MTTHQEPMSVDELQMRAQGHTSELPRQFSLLSTLALAFAITNSWVGYSATFVIPMFAAGGPGVVYGLVVATIACCIITVGLAEQASAFPSSGGQYHFTYMVAPDAWKASLSFFVGWLSIFAWWMTAASAFIFCAQIILYLASSYHPDFVGSQWQVYLVYVALLAMSTALIILRPRQMPTAEIIFFGMSIVGFVVFFIAVLAVSSDQPKQSASNVFAEWNNQTGWGDGVAFLIAVGQCMYTYLAIDAATHIAEEMPNPATAVPRAMGLTMLIGMVTVFAWTMVFLFCATDYDEALATGVPIIGICRQAFDSRAGAAVFGAWLLMIYLGAATSCLFTAGRLTWAFARDNGLPGSRLFAKVNSRLEMPMNATLVSFGFCLFYGLIYIASTTAFNSFISLAVFGSNVTYVFPQAVALLRGRNVALPPRKLDLGPIFGSFVNAFSTLWMVLFGIIFCFPNFLPVTIDTMNYLSVVVVGILVFILGCWWFAKRETYSGPEVNFEDMKEIAALGLDSSLRGAQTLVGQVETAANGADAAAWNGEEKRPQG
ncbi:hypothetical protein PV10_04156 [Exophiala mesophila]|uniref:Amino acid permease/ SLC12A domain-containing protein n=1 Tax=Exophiala mesophila TaxID=212818 RepID=A0A0D1XXD8_EXOME|nr:uncharacterized protein PV10_04156 [Exophiala mesophila]KIV92896.1 hypothetical protein PV10_04156 [Exophiala mesophila]